MLTCMAVMECDWDIVFCIILFKLHVMRQEPLSLKGQV